jgi:hypothetical protein
LLPADSENSANCENPAQCEECKECKITGRIEDSDGKVTNINGWSTLLIKLKERPLVVPFGGTLTVGDDVTVGVDSLLLSGTVNAVEAQLVGETSYVAGQQNLDTGDRVQLYIKPWFKPAYPALVTGFVRAEPEEFSESVNALTLVAHGKADFVRVERLGSEGYKIGAPRWARFLHDPLLAAATAIIMLLALLLEFGSKITGLATGESRDVKNDEKPEQCHRKKGD